MSSRLATMIEKLGYRKILEFHDVPCEVHFNPRNSTTVSVGKFEKGCWLKASKHFYIKAMETRNESGLYSKMQQVSAFQDYLKHNVPEFHCYAYYISQLTPRIVLGNFRAINQLERYNSEHDDLAETLADTQDEQMMLDHLRLFRETGTHDIAAKQLELTLSSRVKLRERLSKLDSELKGAAAIINEWAEKGQAIALLWAISTNIHACRTSDLPRTVSMIEDEIVRIEKLSVRSRAHQQGLLIEELKEPWHMFYAEACGLFHPALRESYRNTPLLCDLAECIETWMNARLTAPIARTGFSEQPSTGVAEALLAFLRQIPTVDKLPDHDTRLASRQLSKPIYLGLIATRTESCYLPGREPYLIDLDDLRNMTLISGATGSGKTRVAQLLAEGASLYSPVIIIDPVGEFTGLIRVNEDASKEHQFKLPNGTSYEPTIYTLDDDGIEFSTNLLLKPDVPEPFFNTAAEEVASILTDLVGDVRFRDIFRETLLESWGTDRIMNCETFVGECMCKSEGMKTSVKLERLLQYKMLMSGEPLDVEELLQNRIVIFSLNSSLYTEAQRLAVIWFILRQMLNHFLGMPHSDSTRALLIVDEVHRLYAENAARSAASVLENIVKQGRAKGLAAVLISQSLQDLPSILTQCHLRILLRILEGEIQSYADKFGMELARSLHSLEPRFGYVFQGSEEFYCAFRPTLSMPKGIADYEELRNYASVQKSLRHFIRATLTRSEPATGVVEQTKPELSSDEMRVIEVLRNSGGTVKSKRQLAQQTGIKGREKIIEIVDQLEEKGRVRTERSGSAVVIKLSSESKLSDHLGAAISPEFFEGRSMDNRDNITQSVSKRLDPTENARNRSSGIVSQVVRTLSSRLDNPDGKENRTSRRDH
jgi:energy-coupling factor transporter ATP-binding protein EcfA2